MVVVVVKPNINQKAQLIEEILNQRKQTIIGIAENVKKEVMFDVKLVSDAPCSQKKLQNALLSVKERDAEWFNVDSNFKESLGNLLALKEETISDFVVENFQSRDTDWLIQGSDFKDALDSLLCLKPANTAVTALNSDQVEHASGKVNMHSFS